MMHEPGTRSLLVLLVGGVVVCAILMRGLLKRMRIPPMIGFMLLGFLLRLADAKWGFLGEHSLGVLEFLAAIGVVVLLFRVGLESNLPGLVHQLPRAGVIWAGNVLLSGLPGYFAARLILDQALIPSLFVAIALTATSVGVSMRVWQERDALKTANGELLIDVAELDDISGVALMAILFAVVPVLREGGGDQALLPAVVTTGGLFLLKLAVFSAVCVFFSRYIERRLTHLYTAVGDAPEPMLLVAGTGIVIAAVAGWLGFSLAIGALFAGLVFSRDPEAVKQEASFGPIYELFTPFFFIGIGLKIQPDALGYAVIPAIVLAVVAIGGKIAGTALPALFQAGTVGALLIGTSMVPRAEIAMIVMERGHSLGSWAVPPEMYAGMVVVSAVTCFGAPLTLHWLLRRYPRTDL